MYWIKIFIILVATQASWVEAAQINCESNRLIRLVDPSNRLFEPQSLQLSGGGRTLISRYNATQSFTYNLETKQAYWATGQRTYPIEEGGYYQSSPDLRSPRGRLIEGERRLIPGTVRLTLSLLKGMDPRELNKNIEACRNQRSFKEQLRSPMLPIEVRSCQKNLEQLHKIQFCEERNNCAEAFEEIQRPRAESQISFIRIFESEIKMTDPTERIGVVMAADSLVTNGSAAALLANKRQVARIVKQVGLRFNAVFSFYYAATFFTKPLLVLFLDYDQCGKGASSSSQDRVLNDCLGQSATKIQSIFNDKLALGIQSPPQFISSISRNPDGRKGRLSCYVFESMLSQWKKKIEEYNNFQCQGRTLSLGTGKNYLIAEDGHLYSHESMERTYHFYKTGGVVIENRSTGKKQNGVFIGDMVNQINQGNPTRAERIQREQQISTRIVPYRIWEEQLLLRAMSSQIDQVIRGGVCNTSAPIESGLSTQ